MITNDGWQFAARSMPPPILQSLLRLTGEATIAMALIGDDGGDDDDGDGDVDSGGDDDHAGDDDWRCHQSHDFNR